MALESRLSELTARHRKIDEELSRALRHPSIDPSTITDLKKRKLQLKEEMERVRARIQ